MEINFDDLYYSAREAQMLWKKRRQHAEGKINLYASDDGWTWNVDECNKKIEHYVKVERWLWKQLPERAQYEDAGSDYVVDSIRLRYDPIQN